MDNLDQTKRELMDEVKGKLIEELNLEEITPEDIDNEAKSKNSPRFEVLDKE